MEANEPTDHEPGTEDKIRVMSARADRELPLHMDGDRTIETGEPYEHRTSVSAWWDDGRDDGEW